MQWCGLKSEYNRLFHTCVEVTTDAVVWIEIGLNTFSNGRKSVTTDAVVWIEISGSTGNINMHGVTTDAVVWIEIEY